MTERRSAKRAKGGAREKPGEAPPPPGSDRAAQERKLTGRVDLGLMSIDIPPEWQFFPIKNHLTARPASGVGVLQISCCATEPIPNSSHEILMGVAKEASGYAIDEPGIDKAKEAIDRGVAGGESFRLARDYVRIWYHRRPEGLVLAWFACPVMRITEKAVFQLVGQCDKMVASIRLPATMDA
ncbi:MAG: hypothetical protein ABIP55_04820 [Tepidisphaeraceae bacterium]